MALANLPGCNGTKPAADPRPSINEVASTNKAVAEDVGTRAATIDKHVEKVKQQVNSRTQASIWSSLLGIRTETDGLREDKVKLEATQAQLQTAIDQSTELTKANQKLSDQVARLESEKRSAVQAFDGTDDHPCL